MHEATNAKCDYGFHNYYWLIVVDVVIIDFMTKVSKMIKMETGWVFFFQGQDCNGRYLYRSFRGPGHWPVTRSHTKTLKTRNYTKMVTQGLVGFSGFGAFV